MGTQQFCLKWNNHQTNMLNVFEQLLSSEALVDVTLACEGLSLKAHKMVLSACSPFFQSLFLENPCKHPIVIMKDMKYTDLKAIVDFMYRGEVNVSQDQLSALLKTAETLKVKGLAEVTGDNRHGPGGLVQQEIIQQHLVNTPQSLPPSGAQTQHRAESPPLSRRKRGRPRRRSLSGSNRSDSEDQVPSKIKEPDSPEVIEEVTSEVESTNDARQRLAPSSHPQSQVSTLHSVHHGVPPLKSHTTLPSVLPQQDTHMSVEEPPSGDEGDYDVEPSKLMEQTMTTENVPVFPDGPSQGPTLPPSSTQLAIPTTVGLADTQSLHTGPGPCDSQSLVSCSMPSEPSTSTCVSQDNNQDIKPGALVSFEEPPISPVAGPSHQESSNSMMMYMDTSGVPAIPGPSSYQLDKQPSQPPQQQQPQGTKDAYYCDLEPERRKAAIGQLVRYTQEKESGNLASDLIRESGGVDIEVCCSGDYCCNCLDCKISRFGTRKGRGRQPKLNCMQEKMITNLVVQHSNITLKNLQRIILENKQMFRGICNISLSTLHRILKRRGLDFRNNLAHLR